MAALLGVLLGVLGLILLSERLKTTTRRRIEALCRLVLYLGASVMFAFSAMENVRRDDWLWAILFGVVAIQMAVTGFFPKRRRDAIRMAGSAS
jgi:hypothetical protein